MQNIQKYFNLFEGARLILSLLHLILVEKLGLARVYGEFKRCFVDSRLILTWFIGSFEIQFPSSAKNFY